MRYRSALLAAGTAVAMTFAAGAALAGKQNDRLVFLAEREPPSFDFFMQSNREGVILNRHIWDGLVRANPMTGEVTMAVAESVRYIDATTIHVTLRQGVKFHNGDPMTAEDVAYTFAFNSNPANRTVGRSRTDWVERVEVIGPYELKLHLPRPFPAAMEFLSSNVPIYPRAYHERLGPDGFSKAPVGTGRYRVERTEIGREIGLIRNADYWEGADKAGHINRIVMRFVPERNTQIAELLAGNAHLIWQVPVAQARRLDGRRGVRVIVGDTMRYGYLQFESGLRPNSRPSPVHDRRVRQAIAHAIDREAIVKNIMGGGSVLHLPCYPSQFGCEAKDAPRYAFDPAKAKQLLAEAGYPNGFEIDFYGYRDRPVAEAILGYLANVGITARLQWLQYSALRDRVRQGEIPFNFMAWGSGSVNDASASVSYFFKGGPDDTSLDPQVIQALTEADSSIDPEVRQRAYARALTRIAQEVYKVPLMSYAYYYAMAADLEFDPTPDEVTHLYTARWR